jgi:uncharacterized protein involved in type VI secretion and phage assembly
MQYFGKYRALVVDVADPESRGRIKVTCPKVLGTAKSAWCEPCVPVCYDSGGDVALPKKGEFVWVEFEEGNANKPIYTGGLWSKNKKPSISTSTRQIEWDGCKITMSKGSLIITNGSATIKLSGGAIYLN